MRATVADQNWKIAGTGDFNGDGKSDILWRNTSTGDNAIWKSGDAATCQQCAGHLADQNWKIAGTGDFNGDGKSDILWRNTSTGDNAIWKSGDAGHRPVCGDHRRPELEDRGHRRLRRRRQERHPAGATPAPVTTPSGTPATLPLANEQ